MKFSIGLKITCMNAIAILALIIIGILNYYSTNRMLTDTDWRQHSYEVKGNIDALLSLLIDVETGVRGYLVTKQALYLEPYNNALIKIPDQLKIVQDLTSDNESQQKRMNLLSPVITKVLTIDKQALNSVDGKNLPVTMDDGKRTMDDIRQIIQEMKNNEDELLKQRIQSSQTSINDTFDSIVYGTIVAAVILTVVGIFLTRNIAIPLREMTEVAAKIAAGELDNSMTKLNRQDEVGVLSRTFTRMSNSLQKFSEAATNVSSGDLTVKVVPQSSNDILGTALAKMIDNLRQYTIDTREIVMLLNTSVNEIYTSISQFVSTGSETASSVSETTSTIEEVRQTSQVANQKAKSVSDNAQLAAQISQKGKQSTQETNEGMMRIRDQMISIAENMILLSEQTQGISTIVETVDDLAQQSNLLSVNASIEAEKAGDQGKGFRIVAQEIKNLADQSKHATQRVREILSDVQKATNKAVLATEQGNKVAEGGVKKAEETGDAITKLSTSVMEAAQAAAQIATSSEQQLIGMEQVSMAMENINEASSQNVDSAKQLEEAVSNLKKISIKLQNLVIKYRVSTERETMTVE